MKKLKLKIDIQFQFVQLFYDQLWLKHLENEKEREWNKALENVKQI